MPEFTRQCRHCRAKFTRHLSPSDLSRKGAPVYCSVSCKNKAIRGQAWGRGKERGHVPWNKALRYTAPKRQRIPRDKALLTRMYWKDGFSTIGMADAFGVSFASLCKVMRELGIPLRTPSEAAKKRMAERTPEERKRNIKAAQDSIRGKPAPHTAQCKRAITVQRIGKLSDHEAAVLRSLKRRGYHPTPLLAVDKYNIDLAFPDHMIGFEVTSGGWHRTPKKKLADKRRCAVMEKMGWTIVDLNTQRTPPAKAAAQIVAFMSAHEVKNASCHAGAPLQSSSSFRLP